MNYLKKVIHVYHTFFSVSSSFPFTSGSSWTASTSCIGPARSATWLMTPRRAKWLMYVSWHFSNKSSMTCRAVKWPSSSSYKENKLTNYTSGKVHYIGQFYIDLCSARVRKCCRTIFFFMVIYTLTSWSKTTDRTSTMTEANVEFCDSSSSWAWDA